MQLYIGKDPDPIIVRAKPVERIQKGYELLKHNASTEWLPEEEFISKFRPLSYEEILFIKSYKLSDFKK